MESNHDRRLSVRGLAVKLTLPVLLSLTGALGSGCAGLASSALPPRLTSAETTRLKRAHLPMTVGVERFEKPAYSESLCKALQRTQLFDRVDYLDQYSSPPSLVARVERRIYGTSTVPVWTLLTCGIIPTFVQEQHGESFSLGPSGRPDERVLVEYVYRGRTTLGWIALVDVLYPSRAVFPPDPERSTRFRDRLALSILERADALKP